MLTSHPSPLRATENRQIARLGRLPQVCVLLRRVLQLVASVGLHVFWPACFSTAARGAAVTAARLSRLVRVLVTALHLFCWVSQLGCEHWQPPSRAPLPSTRLFPSRSCSFLTPVWHKCTPMSSLNTVSRPWWLKWQCWTAHLSVASKRTLFLAREPITRSVGVGRALLEG